MQVQLHGLPAQTHDVHSPSPSLLANGRSLSGLNLGAWRRPGGHAALRHETGLAVGGVFLQRHRGLPEDHFAWTQVHGWQDRSLSVLVQHAPVAKIGCSKQVLHAGSMWVACWGREGLQERSLKSGCMVSGSPKSSVKNCCVGICGVHRNPTGRQHISSSTCSAEKSLVTPRSLAACQPQRPAAASSRNLGPPRRPRTHGAPCTSECRGRHRRCSQGTCREAREGGEPSP
jgi:hypothetical protein